jgi:hypothetical protein
MSFQLFWVNISTNNIIYVEAAKVSTMTIGTATQVHYPSWQSSGKRNPLESLLDQTQRHKFTKIPPLCVAS